MNNGEKEIFKKLVEILVESDYEVSKDNQRAINQFIASVADKIIDSEDTK